MTIRTTARWTLLTAALAVMGCNGGTVLSPNDSTGGADAGTAVAHVAHDGGTDSNGGSPSPSDGGLPLPGPTPTQGNPTPVTSDAGSAPADLDAGSPAPTEQDAGSPAPIDTDAGSSTIGTTPANPSFGCWAWGTPDVNAVVHAGFNWFESGYPGTLSASDNATLTQHGVVPFAYINMSEVANDASLQAQIGSFWSSIAMCSNTSWNTTVVDVRDPRWQDWLKRRANDAYALGNRGIKWDVAGVEDLCNSWSGQPSTAPQEAIDAMASVLADLKAQHPDFKFIVNQGFGLAEQHPELIDGFELENMINYSDANPGDSWSAEMIARVGAIHTNHHIPILDLEYYDLFGCSDTTCAYADQLVSQIKGLDWVPYITVVDMDVQGRGATITPPW